MKYVLIIMACFSMSVLCAFMPQQDTDGIGGGGEMMMSYSEVQREVTEAHHEFENSEYSLETVEEKAEGLLPEEENEIETYKREFVIEHLKGAGSSWFPSWIIIIV